MSNILIGPVQIGYCQLCKLKLRPIEDDWAGRQYHKQCFGNYNHKTEYYREISLDIREKQAKDKKTKDEQELIEILESMGITGDSMEKVISTYK